MSAGTSATAPKEAAVRDFRAAHVITAEDLAQQLDRRPPVLLDIRFRPGLEDPPAEYGAGHLPGAHYVHLPTVLADTGTHQPATNGALPLPQPAILQQALRRYGVNNDSRIVVYDNRHGLSAARGWWVLRWAGLTRVKVLDGGYGYWISQGMPTTTALPRPKQGTVTLRPEGTPGRLATLSTGEATALALAGVLIDARETEHFTGTSAGATHIPAARNLPSSADLDDDGLLLPTRVLRERAEAAGLTSGTAVGSYCGAGVLAAHKVLALATLGIDAALYVGSWSAWSATAAEHSAAAVVPAL